MNWISYTLLAAAIWAVVNIIDKYSLSRLVDNPIAPITTLGLIGGAASALIFFIQGHNAAIPPQQAFLAMLAGSLYLLVMYFYYKAIHIEEVSKVIPLYYLAPIFTLLGSWLILSETVSLRQSIATLLFVSGAIIISTKKGGIVNHNKAAGYMLCAAISYSANQIITKSLLDSNEFWSVFAYGRIGLLVTLIPILFFNRSLLKEQFRKLSYKSTSILTGNQILNVTGILLITMALTKENAGLVNGLASVQPLFVLVMATLLSHIFPRIINENIKSSELRRKFLAVIAIIAGAFLLG